MTKTDQTTDLAIFGVTIPANLRTDALAVAAEVRAIAEQAGPVLERAHALLAESERIQTEAQDIVGDMCEGVRVENIHALDGALHLVALVTGGGELSAQLENLAALTEPRPFD